jgi:indolepyruvate ferredoxin oxidoreductase
VQGIDFSVLPLPISKAPSGRNTYNILITGIGGTGVITIGALLGMASHLEGRGASVLDMTGMSQKNGSVTSHVRLAESPQVIRAQRIPTGEADVIIGCDLLTAGAADSISKTRPQRTMAIINLHEQPTGHFTKERDWQFPTEQLKSLLHDATGGRCEFFDATALATALMGDSIAANLFMLGYAFQKGGIPLGLNAIMKAIELNGVAVVANQTAFQWGRLSAIDPEKVRAIAFPPQAVVVRIIDTRVAHLTAYQDAAYANSYETFVQQVDAKRKVVGAHESITKSVAKGLSKLMAYKDEYEVARLFNSQEFAAQLSSQFEGDFEVSYNLAPPLISRKDSNGKLIKRRFGSWLRHGFPLLAKLKILRGTRFDLLGKTAERKMEKSLITEYRQAMEIATALLTKDTESIALKIAQWPDQIRGFGHVKHASVVTAREQLNDLLAQLQITAKHIPLR